MGVAVDQRKVFCAFLLVMIKQWTSVMPGGCTSHDSLCVCVCVCVCVYVWLWVYACQCVCAVAAAVVDIQ